VKKLELMIKKQTRSEGREVYLDPIRYLGWGNPITVFR
jgi:hypothetical protein